jgi:prophage antirepressor-like protein
MTRSPYAEKMHKALKQIVVPYLREQGFKGTFPHFRRPTETKIDLLSFQFRMQGGGFFIDFASSTPDGIVDGSGKKA